MRRILFAAAVVCSFPLSASALTLDFEGGPGDGTVITDQFAQSHGVIFGIDVDGDLIADVGRNAVIEASGSADADPQGFVSTNASGTYDTAAPGAGSTLGGFFLRAGGLSTGNFTPNLLIRYTAPVAGASGEIWDIDAESTTLDEQWIVHGFNAAKQEVASATSPLGVLPNVPGSLDSLPWTWSLTGDITYIRLEFTGSKPPADIGLAFDNFTVDRAVPEPGTLALLGAGAVAGLARGRRAARG